MRRLDHLFQNLAEFPECRLAGLPRELLPHPVQAYAAIPKKGVDWSVDAGMILLLEIPPETAAATPLAATNCPQILPQTAELKKPERFGVEGACDCYVCCDSYPVETDAFNDGGIHYWPSVMAELEVDE